MPAGQGLQSAGSKLPVLPSFMYVPAWQAVQVSVARPSLSLYVPGAQGVQVSVPRADTSLHLPIGHSGHSVLPKSGLNLPGAQVVQRRIDAVGSAGEKRPGGQGEQAAWPSWGAYVPVLQLMQPPLFSSGWCLPASQRVHSIDPVLAANFPTAQTVQEGKTGLVLAWVPSTSE